MDLCVASRDKDRNDRRGSMLADSVMSEPKETGRGEKETDWWETRERVEQNDGERNKEKKKKKIILKESQRLVLKRSHRTRKSSVKHLPNLHKRNLWHQSRR